MFGLDLVKTAKKHLNNKESIKLYFYVNIKLKALIRLKYTAKRQDVVTNQNSMKVIKPLHYFL